jgi:plastocyanin
MPRMRRGGSGYGPLVVGCVSAAFVLSGCGLQESGTDVVNGKMLFSTKCGACHTLARAGTTGTVGPDLDDAFRQSREDGLKTSTFKGIVLRQIEDPNINPQIDPDNLKPLPSMPANVVKGQDARDVAAYVAQAAGVPGKDGGRLAEVGAKKASGTAKEQSGTLAIPVASAGLAYQYANASATAGQVTITSKNPQPTDHDIAIEGNGVNVKGQLVQSGGTSKLTANLKPGTYTFFCSVPGHRQGGMVGKLVVK